MDEVYEYPLENELDPRLEVELIVVEAFSLMLDIKPEDLDIVLDRESSILAFKLSPLLEPALLGNVVVVLPLANRSEDEGAVPILGVII